MEIARARCNGTYGDQYLQILEVTVNSQSIENNTSNITITYTNRNDAGTSGNHGWANPATITIQDANGQRNQWYENSYTDYRNGTVVTLGSWTTDVKHNLDGTLNLSVSASFSSGSSNLSGGSVNNSTTLPTIPREAKITETNNFNDEQNPYFKFSNPTNAPMSCWLEPKPNGEHLAIRQLTGTSGTYTWELTNEERNQLRSKCTDNNSCICRIGLYSTIGSTTFANFVDVTMSIVNANPVFSDFDFIDTNATTVALTGGTHNNVKGYSNIRVFVPTNKKATAQKGATMSKYRFVIDKQTTDIAYSDNDTVYGDINNSQLGVYNVYAIDSRKNSTLVTKNADNNIEYEPISFNTSSCKVERNNGGVGAYAVLTLSGNIWNDNFGQVSNSIKNIYYQYKKTSEGDSAWQTGPTTITPTLSNNNFSFTGQVGSNDTSDDNKFELQTSYNFRIIIEDELSTATIDLTPMGSAVPNISFADDGVGIMCDYDDYLGGELQVGGEVFNNYPKDWLKIQEVSASVTAGGNDYTVSTIGSINPPTGYTYVGILPNKNGYGDQWLASYSEYGNNVVVIIYNKYNSTLTNTVSCRVIYIRTDLYNEFKI